MDQCGHFAKSLEAIRKVNNANLTEFSEELDIPKSTLQDILKDGNTSLHTALHIADRLNVPLSTLTSDAIPAENLDVLAAFLKCFDWFSRLPREEQDAAVTHIRALMELLRK